MLSYIRKPGLGAKMAVGNTINYSIPVVGTTVGSVLRANGNSFVGTYAGFTGSYPVTLTLRPASSLLSTKRYGLSFVVKPSVNDDPGIVSKGRASVSLNIDASIGSVVTAAELAEFVRYALSQGLHSNLLEDLANGISL